MTTTQESAVLAPFAGTVIAIAHEPGDAVQAGNALVILEAMKMEHEVIAEVDGVVARLEVSVGDTVDEGQLLGLIEPGHPEPEGAKAPADSVEASGPRTDLDAVHARHAITLDDARPDAV